MRYFFLATSALVFLGGGCGDAYVTGSDTKGNIESNVVIPGMPSGSPGIKPPVSPSPGVPFSTSQ